MTLTENRLSEAVSVFTYGGETLAESYGSNATVFFGNGAVVVVDPFVAPSQAAALGARIAARTGDPVTHVVLTHHHTDHALGGSWFKAFGAEVIAHAEAGRRMALEHAGLLAERRKDPALASVFEGAEPYAPTRLVTDGLAFEAGGFRFDVFHPGHAHTPGDLCVYAPSLGVLVSGDLVSTGYHPNLEDADVAGWRSALDRLLSLPFWILVPGHGAVGGREAVRDQLHYLDRTREIVAKGAGSDRGDETTDALALAFPEFRLKSVLPLLVERLRRA
jgi:glyoxylase-like metal-dependent hydrolase (beta-lactamase superfamily II)